MRYWVPLAALLLASPALADGSDSNTDPASEVSEERLQTDVETLVSFGTRHTMSVQDSDTHGIGAARRWAESEFRSISEDCGGCLEIALPEEVVEGRRISVPTRLVNVVAIQRGTERPNEVTIVQAHIDSRATDVSDHEIDAPGANDDGSGTALVIEAARILSKQSHPTTIIYALLSGEEQGLYGGRLMVRYVAEQGWTVKAVLNNDVVGNSCGSDGYCDAENVRIFSEGPRADLTDSVRAAQRRSGGENDSPSRNLSRWIDTLAADTQDGLDVRQIWRVDRMGRGGDQIPFLEAGYPAVRFSVAVEDYEHQHQDLNTEKGVVYGDIVDAMDFAYLAKVTQLNIRALHRLSRTPQPPAPTAQAAVRIFTEVNWEPVEGAESYSIWKRRTDQPYWEEQATVAEVESFSWNLEGLRGDDWIIGVSSISHHGIHSPIASAVPGGQFAPIPQP